MCLAIPMEVVEVDGKNAKVLTGGVTQQIRLDVMSETVQKGDYVVVHAGFALTRLDREEALATLKLFAEGFGLGRA
jgi:hydrogenase expression/formation protein HypC